jgi:predicted ATPase
MAEQKTDDPTIRTPDQRLRIFVSSTLAELADERAAVAEAISSLRLTPVLFELGARPHPPRELYRAYLAQSDVFVGLYWQRYGWIGPDMEISGLEDELQLSDTLPRLLYLKKPAPQREARLTAMLDQLQRDGSESYRPFTTADELAQLVRDDLALLLSERFMTPPAAHDPREEPSRSRSLPLPPTSLLGREIDVAQVAKLIETPDVRLVTLTGPGGIGKTRLAIAAAEALQDRYDHGAVFVPLASVSNPELVLPRVANAIGASIEGTRPALDVIADALGDATLLLVLDNLEQVIDVAPDINELIARCAGLEVVATSRTVLRLRAECEYPVEPLSVPGVADNPSAEHLASVAAVQLFVDRAQAVRHSFALTPDNAASIAAICRRLEGLPLAIELAAARVRLLEPDALLSRLERGLDVLGTGPVDLPERQRTLRATVEWSIGLLDDRTRDMLATLSVFVDGWTIDAATQVSGLPDDETLDLLDALAGHSLVKIDATDINPRFRMLELVRELAEEHLERRDDAADVAQRHAQYFGQQVLESDWLTDGQEEWAGRIGREEGNIARAVRWHFDHDVTPLPHIFRTLWLQWQMRDQMPEARWWLDELLERADELNPPSRANLFLTAGVTAGEVGDDASALALAARLEQTIDELDDPYLESAAQLAFSWARTMVDDYDGALDAARRALEGLTREDEAVQGVSGFAPYITPSASLTVGMLEMTVGRVDAARSHLTDVKDAGDDYHNVFLASGGRAQLAWLAVTTGDLDDARALLAEAIDVPDDDELTTHPLSFCLVSLAKLRLAEGEPDAAAVAMGAADGVRERAGVRGWSTTRPYEAELVAELKEVLGETRADIGFARGFELSRAEAIQLMRDDL